MNLSGESVIEAINFYKISKENLIVIYDDFDTDSGSILLFYFLNYILLILSFTHLSFY